jgi:hypothetical protein
MTSMHATEVDERRLTNARTASHGFGAGQTEARRLMAHWPAEEAAQRATQILDHVELAQDYAQAAPSLFEEYLGQLRAADPSDDPLTRDRQSTLATIYQAGFDIGFSAALVEACGVLLGRGRATTIGDTGEVPADKTDAAYLTWS